MSDIINEWGLFHRHISRKNCTPAEYICFTLVRGYVRDEKLAYSETSCYSCPVNHMGMLFLYQLSTSKHPLPFLCSDLSAETKVMSALALSWTVSEEDSFVCANSSIPRLQTVDSSDFSAGSVLSSYMSSPLELWRIIAATSLIWTKALHSEATVPHEWSFYWFP